MRLSSLSLYLFIFLLLHSLLPAVTLSLSLSLCPFVCLFPLFLLLELCRRIRRKILSLSLTLTLFLPSFPVLRLCLLLLYAYVKVKPFATHFLNFVERTRDQNIVTFLFLSYFVNFFFRKMFTPYFFLYRYDLDSLFLSYLPFRHFEVGAN